MIDPLFHFLLACPLLAPIAPPGVPTGDALNLGHALANASTFTTGDGFFAFVVSESSDGDTDLNGDGDAIDRVLHVFDEEATTTMNLELAVDSSFPDAVGSHLAFTVFEGSQAFTDLNGDGDTEDLVAHVYDHATRAVTNLGLAVFSPADMRISRDVIVLPVFEIASTSISGQGVDLNGDGDTFDHVAHVHHLVDGSTVNLGLSILLLEGVVNRELVAFSVLEAGQAGSDLNGDGDAADSVLHVHYAFSGRTWNTELAGSPLGLSLRALVGLVDENEQGTDLNGDGDLIDFVLHRFDLGQETASNKALALNPGSNPVDDRWALLVALEAAQGQADLNGDGDAEDAVLHLYDTALDTLANLGLAVLAGGAGIGLPMLGPGLATFWVTESAQGVDLNGNGNTFDDVMHVHDVTLDSTLNLALASQLPASRVDAARAAFLVSETSRLSDLNGDGDMEDRWVVHLFDRRTQATINLGWAGAGARFSLGETHVAVLVDEIDQGNTDLNGDGDSNDFVFHLYRATDGATRNLGLAGTSSSSSALLAHFGESHVACLVSENGQGQDLNGDGDMLDTVPFVLPL